MSLPASHRTAINLARHPGVLRLCSPPRTIESMHRSDTVVRRPDDLATTKRGMPMSEANKAIVRHPVGEIMNGGDLDVIGELYASRIAPTARRWIVPFREALPDVRMDVIERIAKGDTALGTTTAPRPTSARGSATRPRSDALSGSTRSASSASAADGSSAPGVSRTPSSACGNSDSLRTSKRAHDLDAYMITATPASAITPPIRS